MRVKTAFKRFNRGQEMMNIPFSQLVVCHPQIFTDILGASNLKRVREEFFVYPIEHEKLPF